ncbi:GroES-like protein [Athelia psychrophila]|uniref:GroES-like protein n=1 Tax=Athelia psychrophila TaxID=1759441 RepID=A0A166C2Y5_9AGAM|nr:GroES-like protein [Fibularhizoctonia sp. CBS 109695]
MSSPSQKALFIPSKQAAFAVASTGVPTPAAGELLVKIQAAGLNPIDWKIQKYGFAVETYPAIIGSEFSGTVEAVGEGVTSFQKGDRVACAGKWVNDYSAFQQFALAAADFTAKLPPSISFDQAASVPVGVATAAIGLYQTADFGAGLTAPWEQGGKGKYEGKPLLVLGGAGSVGSYAIQFAKLSGFSPIIATASLHNSAHLKSLGATHVIDRHLDTLLLCEEIAKITSVPIEVVFDAVGGPQTQQSGVDVLAPGGVIASVAQSKLGDAVGDGKSVKSIFASPFHPHNRDVAVGFASELTAYLESGDIQPNRIEVLAGGLSGVADGLARLQDGKVSGVKLIVRPQEAV